MNRTGASYDTVVRNLRTLSEEGLLTVIKQEGKSDLYQLTLNPMQNWETTQAHTARIRQARAEKKADWARRKREALTLKIEDRVVTHGTLTNATPSGSMSASSSGKAKARAKLTGTEEI